MIERPTTSDTASPAANVELMSRSPMPSRRPIVMIIKFSGGDASALSSSEKIQDMQVAIACALNLPLEKIRILSISYTDASGTTVVLPVDPTQYMIIGNGVGGCGQTSSGRRMLRKLQNAGGSVNVEYSILQPSDTILAMSTEQINAAISSSSMIQTIAASVGSSNIVSAQGVPISNVAPRESNTNIGPYIGGGIGAAATLVVIAMLVFRKKTKSITSHKQADVKRDEIIKNPLKQ